MTTETIEVAIAPIVEQEDLYNVGTLQLSELEFCAQECARQNSGEMSVFYMAAALLYAFGTQLTTHNVTVYNVKRLGAIVEPEKNLYGTRITPVTVGGTVIPVVDFDRALLHLLQSEMSPEEKYQQFQMLHPFVDGNGRVGAILYNVWAGNIQKTYLETPPLFRKLENI